MSLKSLLTETPENTSLLQITKFIFLFPEMPFLRYYCQTVQIPAISTNEINVPTQFSFTKRHGEKLNFEPLTITAIVDEDMRVWEETYSWLRGLTRPTTFDEYPRRWDPKAPLYLDGYLITTTNANNANIRWKFLNCHPTNIGNISFDTKLNADSPVTVDFTFVFDYYQIDRSDESLTFL